MDLENEKHFINSLKDDELHRVYKITMENIVLHAVTEISELVAKNPDTKLVDIKDWVHKFVEETFG